MIIPGSISFSIIPVNRRHRIHSTSVWMMLFVLILTQIFPKPKKPQSQHSVYDIRFWIHSLPQYLFSVQTLLQFLCIDFPSLRHSWCFKSCHSCCLLPSGFWTMWISIWMLRWRLQAAGGCWRGGIGTLEGARGRVWRCEAPGAWNRSSAASGCEGAWKCRVSCVQSLKRFLKKITA